MVDHLTPEHPAANMAYDAQGRAVQLHLSEAEIRLECVKIVAAHPQCFIGHAIGAAQEVASFVMTGEMPWGSDTSSATSPEPELTDEQIATMLTGKAPERPSPITVRTVEFPPGSAFYEAMTKAPERPALSEEAKAHLRERIAVLSLSVAVQAQDVEFVHRDLVSRSTRLAKEREEIAALQRDLGEPSAP